MENFKLKKSAFYPLVFLMLIYACHNQSHEHADKAIFKYNEAANILTLDPVFARDQAHIWVCNQLYNGLVQLDDQMLVQPAIAKRWVISEDGLNYTFYLRDDVYFHDDVSFKSGRRKVKAADFVYSFNRLLDPQTASPGVWVLSAIDTLKGGFAIEATSDSIFQIRLKKPFPPFLSILSMQYCSVLPMEAVNYYGVDFRSHPVGTGPFQLTNWEENIKLVLRKNENYFEKQAGKKLPYIDGVSISFTADKMTAFMEFAQGKLDLISGIDASYKDELISSDGSLAEKYRDKFNLSKIPYLNTEYLGILVDTASTMVKESPLQLRNIRQAISYGFDREKMIYYLRNSIGTPGLQGMLPKGLATHDNKAGYGYDYQPKKSVELLLEAGYNRDNLLPPINLVTTADYLDICKFVQSQLRELGIDINIEVVPPAAAIEMRALSKVMFFRASWIADYPDEENYLSLFYTANFSPAGPNYTHFSNTEFDLLYDEALRTVLPQERQQLYRKMDSLVMGEAPIVVLYYDQVLRFTQKNITGLGSNPINLLNLKYLKISR